MPDAGSTPDRDGSRSDCACNNGGGGGGATCSSGSTVGVAGRGHGGVSATLKHTSPTAAAGVAGAAAAPPLCSCGAGRGGGSGNCSGSSAPPPPPTAPPQLPPTPTSGGSVSATLPQRVVRPARLPIRPRVRSGDGPLRRTSMGRGGGGRRPPHVGCCSSGGNGGRSGGGESARRGGGAGLPAWEANWATGSASAERGGTNRRGATTRQQLVLAIALGVLTTTTGGDTSGQGEGGGRVRRARCAATSRRVALSQFCTRGPRPAHPPSAPSGWPIGWRGQHAAVRGGVNSARRVPRHDRVGREERVGRCPAGRRATPPLPQARATSSLPNYRLNPRHIRQAVVRWDVAAQPCCSTKYTAPPSPRLAFPGRRSVPPPGPHPFLHCFPQQRR